MASSTLNVTLRTRAQGTGAKDTEKQLVGLNKTIFGLKDAMGLLAGSTAVGAVIAGLKFAVTSAMEAEKVMAQTEAVIRSTGGAAGLTAPEIARMAGRLQDLTGIADETIQSGQNMLLTFKEIKGDTFERATRAMTDMAVAMNQGNLEGIDLKGTAIQLGKALNDPLKGVTALAKVGVQFSAAQREAIKEMVAMNDIAGAQAIILAELESQFGGAAEAAGNTFAGSLARLKNAVGDLAEEIGTALIPVLKDAAEAALILVRWNKTVSEALAEHEQQVTLTADSYEAYVREMVRAAQAAGRMTDVSEEQIQSLIRGTAVNSVFTDTIKNQADRLGILSEEQFNAARAAAEQAAAVESAAAATSVYARTLVDANAQLNAQDQWLADIAGVGLPRVAEQTYSANAAMETYSRTLLFNKASANLDADAQLVLAAHLGLVDNATLTLMGKLPQLTEQFDTNGNGAIDAGEDVQGYIRALLDLAAQLDALDGKTVTTYVNVVGPNDTIAPPSLLTPPPPGAAPGPVPMARGGDFIVPPGYPNDTFPIAVSSGERVTVTPASANPTAPVGAANYTFNIYPPAGANGQQLGMQLRRALQSGIVTLGG